MAAVRAVRHQREGAYAVRLYLNRRDDATGTWLRLMADRLESRQLRFEHNRQGNWSYFIEYGRIPRYEPCTVTTGVGGIGSNNLTVPATPTTAPRSISRRAATRWTGVRQDSAGRVGLHGALPQREKGARVFGRGTTGSVAGFAGNFELRPSPSTRPRVSSRHWWVSTGEKLQLSGGTTAPCSITTQSAEHHGGVPAATPASTAFTPGLPPDNSSHQLFSGGYGFTPTTRGTFKLSYAKAKQDAFPTGAAVPLFPGVGNNLQGKVDTTLAQWGSCRARYRNSLSRGLPLRDRDDRTPVVQYFTGSSTSDGFNEPRSIRTTKGVVEAAISCPARSA